MKKGFRYSAVPILDPITQFCSHCSQWETELVGAVGARAALAATPNAGALDKLDEISAPMQEKFDSLSMQLMCETQTMPWFPWVSDLIREIAAAITAVREWSAASAIEIYTQSFSHGNRDPFGSARIHLHRSIAELKRYEGLLPAKSHRNPLTDRQLEIWNALEYQAYSAKELANLIGAPDEPSVRQMILKIKKSGWQIEHQAQRGYYRVDAPPIEFGRFQPPTSRPVNV